MRHGTFTFDCIDCVIDQSNDSHYGGLWREKKKKKRDIQSFRVTNGRRGDRSPAPGVFVVPTTAAPVCFYLQNVYTAGGTQEWRSWRSD